MSPRAESALFLRTLPCPFWGLGETLVHVGYPPVWGDLDRCIFGLGALVKAFVKMDAQKLSRLAKIYARLRYMHITYRNKSDNMNIV